MLTNHRNIKESSVKDQHQPRFPIALEELTSCCSFGLICCLASVSTAMRSRALGAFFGVNSVYAVPV